MEQHTSLQTIKGLPTIKNMVAVASGKGGVGKSTIAVNLALALAHEGAKVGLLDADIYGPSQPLMLGAQQKKCVIKEGKIQPLTELGIQSLSIGYLIDAASPMVWRGPMLGKALQQFIYDCAWDQLDYLILDLPPGTGDVQLTLCQKLPLRGVVMVTTPQDMALADVKKATAMFKKLNVPILGVVENMSEYACKHCGHLEPIFGQGGADKLAEEFQLNVLARLPLSPEIRELTDSGQPPALKGDPIFLSLAHQVVASLALLPKDYSAKFPRIVKG